MDSTRRGFLKNTVQFLAAAGLSVLHGCKDRESSQYPGIGGNDPYIEDGNVMFTNYRGVQSVSIDELIFPSKAAGIAKIKDLSIMETLLNRDEVERTYRRMRFEHPVKVGDKIQVIIEYRIYEYSPNDPKSLKPLTPEGEYWVDQWKTLQGHVVRQGGKQIDDHSEMFYILKDGKWKSITGVYNFSLTFSPDGKKAYSAGYKIFEYDVVENNDNITMKGTKTKNKIRDEFENVREIKAIIDGYVFVKRGRDHDKEIWKTDLNWTEATCLYRRKQAVLDLRVSKDYLTYESFSKYGGSVINVLPLTSRSR